MGSNQRREFIKKSILGMSGAALLPGTVRAALSGVMQQTSIMELPARVLGRTGIKN